MRIFTVLVFLVCVGCANVSHTKITFDKEGNVVSKEMFEYDRFGGQKIGRFTARVNEDGIVDITLEQQKGDAGLLGEALKNATEVGLVIAKKLPKGGL